MAEEISAVLPDSVNDGDKDGSELFSTASSLSVSRFTYSRAKGAGNSLWALEIMNNAN